jgi:WD40 repeat protein
MKPVAKEITVVRANNDVSSIDFSPDGQHLATGAALGPDIQIWAWPDGQGQLERTVHIPKGLGPGTSQSGLQYSADGRFLAIVHGRSRESEGYGVVRIWDARSGAVAGQISEPSGGGYRGGIAFTPDGQFLLRSYDRIDSAPGDDFVVHRLGKWDVVWGLRTNPFIPESLALSPDGKRVALGGEVFEPKGVFSQILIVDLKSRMVTISIDAKWRGASIDQITWSPDNLRIAVGVRLKSSVSGQSAIRAFDIRDGRQLFEQREFECAITGLAFTPDGKYFIQGGKGIPTEVWDGEHKKLLQKIPASADALALSPDGHHFAIAERSAIAIWELM